MKIFIDFDDVIFNTKAFGIGLRNVFVAGGISKKTFDSDYLDYPVKGKNGIRKYDAWHHLKLIKKRGFNTKDAEIKMRSFLKNTKAYVFADVIDFLRKFERRDIFLISYGVKKFQETKMNNSGLRKRFKKCIISDNSKGGEIKKLIKQGKIDAGENIYFIEDRVKWIEETKKKCPKVTTFLVKRKEGRYRDKKSKFCDFEIKNLKEAKKIILALEKNGRAK